MEDKYNILDKEKSTESHYVIRNGVKEIPAHAFDIVEETSIKIPNSVTEIKGGAFSGCIGLTSIIIPNSVTKIGEGAFYGCTGLESIHCWIKNINKIVIALNAFEECNVAQCTLYVRISTGYAYRHHPIFSQFKEVIVIKDKDFYTLTAEKNLSKNPLTSDYQRFFSIGLHALIRDSFHYSVYNSIVAGRVDGIVFGLCKRLISLNVYVPSYGQHSSKIEKISTLGEFQNHLCRIASITHVYDELIFEDVIYHAMLTSEFAKYLEDFNSPFYSDWMIRLDNNGYNFESDYEVNIPFIRLWRGCDSDHFEGVEEILSKFETLEEYALKSGFTAYFDSQK